MSIYNFYLTNPFGNIPRTLEWIYLQSTGGDEISLDGEPTVGSDASGTNCRIVTPSNSVVEFWQLISSNHISDPPNGWVRPLDYSDSTNQVVWHRLPTYGAGGAVNASLYKFNSSTSGGNPGTGYVSLDNAIPASALTLFVNVINGDGTNITGFLYLLTVGDTIVIQDQDDFSEAVRYTITSITNNGSWWTIGVGWRASQPGVSFPNNAKVVLLVQM